MFTLRNQFLVVRIEGPLPKAGAARAANVGIDGFVKMQRRLGRERARSSLRIESMTVCVCGHFRRRRTGTR